MGLLHKIYNQILFARMNQRIKRLPESQQRIIGQKVYEEGYNAFKATHADGGFYGACSVLFECPYDGHVFYHIQRELDQREADPADPTVYAQVKKLPGDKWLATAVVKLDTQDNAMFAADACVMSAILSAKTVSGNFTRYMSCIDVSEQPLPEKEECMEALYQVSAALLQAQGALA